MQPTVYSRAGRLAPDHRPRGSKLPAAACGSVPEGSLRSRSCSRAGLIVPMALEASSFAGARNEEDISRRNMLGDP